VCTSATSSDVSINFERIPTFWRSDSNLFLSSFATAVSTGIMILTNGANVSFETEKDKFPKNICIECSIIYFSCENKNKCTHGLVK
jgi:hypothetical protein